MLRQFRQVDVFAAAPYRGNPLAVVIGADGMTGEQMQAFANWTNLSETTFVLEPDDDLADYQIRIFTPSQELPFAGHPTLGTCHAWLEAGGEPRHDDMIIQQCGAGLITVRRDGAGLRFAAPPVLRSGPVDEPLAQRIAGILRIGRDEIVDLQWADNGPGWIAVLLASADEVLALRPGPTDLDLGVAGPYPAGSAAAYEVRAFMPGQAGTDEDPVTGSLNASLAQWLITTGRASAPYLASQGTALGRSGEVRITADEDGVVWVGGSVTTCVTGHVEL